MLILFKLVTSNTIKYQKNGNLHKPEQLLTCGEVVEEIVT